MISIIVPVYRVEHYLRQCVDSVLAQTYSDWELILVDDGSPDDCGHICDSYASRNSRIKVLHTRNQGVSMARNRGLEIAEGDFITFLDADDVLHPLYLQVLVRLMSENPAAGVSTVAYLRFEQDPFEATEFRNFQIISTKGEDYVERALYQTFGDCSPCAKLYRKELFEGLGFRKGSKFEDLDLFYRIIEQTEEVVTSPWPLYGYRDNKEGFINNFSGAHLDVLDVTDRMQEYYREKGNSRLLLASRVRRFAAHFNILCLIYANNKDWKEAEDRCLSVIKEESMMVLKNCKARSKDRIGAMVSIIAPLWFIRRLARISYKR